MTQYLQYLNVDAQLPDDADSDDSDQFRLHRLGKASSELIMVSVGLNGPKVEMEVDTGATFSFISEATRQAVFPNQTLQLSDLRIMDRKFIQ